MIDPYVLPDQSSSYCLTGRAGGSPIGLEEETGLRDQNLRFLFYQDSLPPAPGQMHCINLYFECAVEGNLMLNRESAEFRWIGKEELSNVVIAFRNDEALIRYWNEK